MGLLVAKRTQIFDQLTLNKVIKQHENRPIYSVVLTAVDKNHKMQQWREWSVDNFDATEIQHGSWTKSDGTRI